MRSLLGVVPWNQQDDFTHRSQVQSLFAVASYLYLDLLYPSILAGKGLCNNSKRPVVPVLLPVF